MQSPSVCDTHQLSGCANRRRKRSCSVLCEGLVRANASCSADRAASAYARTSHAAFLQRTSLVALTSAGQIRPRLISPLLAVRCRPNRARPARSVPWWCSHTKVSFSTIFLN
jgi:hypothetical protein